MKLVISQLQEGENPFTFSSAKESWFGELLKNLSDKGYRFLSPMTVDFKLIKCEPDYYLKGAMDFEVEQTCGRCAEVFNQKVTHPFGVSLAHIATSRVATTPPEDEDSDLDINFFEGNEIDMKPILEEQFFLSLPYQSRCSEDCKGVCQSCGQNLNQKLCTCSHKNIASPFSVLQHMHI